MRKLTYYIAATIDGFIAGPNGEFDFFPIEDDVTEAMNAERPETVPTRFRDPAGLTDTPNRQFDAVLMGRGTYEVGLKQGVTAPFAHLKQYVFSRTLTTTDPEVEIISGDPAGFVRELKQREGAGIWLCGGGVLAAQLAGEIDEMIVKRNPIVLGDGIRLFDGPFNPRPFSLTGSRTFASGVVVQAYSKK